MAKRMWLWYVTALVVVVAGLLAWSQADNLKDRLVWSRFRGELTAMNVTKVEFGVPGKPITLTDADRREFLALLRDASFDRSNRAGNGPTPGAVITLTFADGRQEQIGMWSFTSYEVSPRQLDPKSQFLIKSEALGAWLRNHFQAPTLGAGGLKAPGAFPVRPTWALISSMSRPATRIRRSM